MTRPERGQEACAERSRKRVVAAAAMLLALLAHVPAADAHRLDEYLQATRVAIDVDRVALELDLTAGANIASGIFALIDSDRDGRLSDAEQQRYARDVINAVRLSVDGRTSPVALVSQQFPTFDEMAAGTGTIRLQAETRSPLSSGRHHIAYLNAHAPDASVYLVNALVPTNARVHIGSPARDPKQHGLMLDVEVAPDAMWLRAGWTMTALAGLLVFRSRLGSGSRTLAAARVRSRRRALRS